VIKNPKKLRQKKKKEEKKIVPLIQKQDNLITNC